jgi:hypothetical protein
MVTTLKLMPTSQYRGEGRSQCGVVSGMCPERLSAMCPERSVRHVSGHHTAEVRVVRLQMVCTKAGKATRIGLAITDGRKESPPLVGRGGRGEVPIGRPESGGSQPPGGGRQSRDRRSWRGIDHPSLFPIGGQAPTARLATGMVEMRVAEARRPCEREG